MKEVIFEMGRKYGNTLFFHRSHSFLFFTNPKQIPYQDANILAVVDNHEIGNNRRKSVRVIGLHKEGSYSFSRKEVKVNITRDTVIEDEETREAVRKILRKEYGEDMEIKFLDRMSCNPDK